MSEHTLISRVLESFYQGYDRPAFIFQCAVLLFAVGMAWFAAHRVYRKIETRLAGAVRVSHQAQDMLRFSVEGVRRLAFPLTAMGVILIGALILRMAQLQDEWLLRLGLLLFGAMAVIRFCIYVLRRAFERSALLQTYERTLSGLIWLSVALYATGLMDGLITLLDGTALSLGQQRFTLWTLFQAFGFVIVTVVVALWAGSALEARLMRSHTLNSSLRQVLARLFKAILLVVAVLIALSTLGIDLTVLSVFGGALGVGLGLGLQRIASNYVSGFIILLDRSLRIGDLIEVESYSGVVTQINTRYTVLRALNGKESIIPNEMLVSSAVTNYAYTDRKISIHLDVTVSYNASIDQALACLERAARGPQRVLSDPAPSAVVMGFGADGIDLRLYFWINDPENGQFGIRSDVARSVFKNLTEAGIGIPYPQRELRWAHGATPMPVVMATDQSGAHGSN